MVYALLKRLAAFEVVELKELKLLAQFFTIIPGAQWHTSRLTGDIWRRDYACLKSDDVHLRLLPASFGVLVNCSLAASLFFD